MGRMLKGRSGFILPPWVGSYWTPFLVAEESGGWPVVFLSSFFLPFSLPVL